MNASPQVITISADHLEQGDLLVGYGTVIDVTQGALNVDVTYEKSGTSSGMGTMSLRWDTEIKIRR